MIVRQRSSVPEIERATVEDKDLVASTSSTQLIASSFTDLLRHYYWKASGTLDPTGPSQRGRTSIPLSDRPSLTYLNPSDIFGLARVLRSRGLR